MAANVVTDGAGAAAGAAVAQQQQLGVREVLAALDPTAMLLLIITLLSFLLPVIVLYPPVPATISDALRQSHRKLGLDFDGSDKQVSSGPATAKKRPFSSAKKGTAAGAEADAASTCTVQGITIYPVKSCAGIRVSRARVTRTGLQFDRLFTFAQLRTPFPLPVAAGDVDAVVADDRASNKAAVASSATESAVGNAASDGKVGAAAAAKKRGAVVEEPDVPRDDTAQGEWHFVTQRQFPLLATVSVDVWLPDMARSASMQNPFRGSRDAGAGFVVLRFPSPTPSNRLLAVASWCAAKLARGLRAVPESEILLPLEFPDKEAIAARGYKFERITIWKDTITALNVSSEIPDELARYLGISNRLGLFRIDPNSLREVYRCAPRKEEAGYQPVIGFQDGYPLHMLNLASVKDLQSTMAKHGRKFDLDPRRFRCNILMSGLSPYDEESWKEIRLKPGTSGLSSDAAFQVSCRTVRCTLPNVHPDTGARDREEPDRSLRAHRAVDDGAPGKGCMGMQICPLFPDASGTGGRDEDLESWIAVGMTVEVVKRGKHLYIPQQPQLAAGGAKGKK